MKDFSLKVLFPFSRWLNEIWAFHVNYKTYKIYFKFK